MTIEPTHVEAWHLRAQAQSQLGLMDDAVASFRHALMLRSTVC